MIERSEIQWGMTPIPYVIRRTGREKTVALTIEGRGKLVVTAPEGVSIDRLNGIVRRKAPWVMQRIRRVSDLPPPPSEREFVSGETVRYLGGQYRLKVVETRGDERVRLWAGWYEVPIPAGLEGPARRREVRRRLAGSLKQHADLYLPDRLTEVCRILRVERPSIIVREQGKRWGSCDRRGVLRVDGRANPPEARRETSNEERTVPPRAPRPLLASQRGHATEILTGAGRRWRPWSERDRLVGLTHPEPASATYPPHQQTFSQRQVHPGPQ